ALVHPDDRANFRAHSINAGRSGQRAEFEYRLVRAGADLVDIRQVLEQLPSQAGGDGAARWFNTLQYVTEQKQFDRELHRFRLAMDMSMDSVYLTDVESMRFV